jgi:selenocysteine-specific elongation factor
MTNPRIKRIIGTAGHIDHGKTAVVKALTGTDCDRLPEEKRRGITIDLGFASWRDGDVQLGFVDVPGHERFVKNMLAGAGGIDAALLIVAADESIKPQTREHFAICRLLGIRTGVVAITKSDLVDPDIIGLVRLEVEDLVAGSFLHGKPVVAVSSVTGQGIDALRRELLAVVGELPERQEKGRVFRLPIDRVFTMRGFGSVVTGTTYAGSLQADAEVEILPPGLRSRARNIQVHGEPREMATAGERTSINLADLQVSDLHRGDQVVEPGIFAPSQVVTARLDLLADSKPLKEQTRIRFHHGASELLGSIRIVDGSGSEILPGRSSYVQIRLEKPVVAVWGDRFVIRRYSPAVTIGGGVIIDAHLPKLSRGTRQELLDTLADGDLPARVELMAKLAGLRGLTLPQLQSRTGLRIGWLNEALPKNAVPRLASLSDGGTRKWLHLDVIAEVRRRAIDFLERYFAAQRMAVSVPKGEFLQKVLPTADSATTIFLLDDLRREGIIHVAGDAVEVPGRSKTLGGAEGELARSVEARFATAGLQPPPVSELIRTIPQKPKVMEGIVSFLVKQGVLVRIADGVYLHRDVVAEAKTRMTTQRGKTIDVGAFKDFFGLSRKIAIPLLELFDREGVTRRQGDARLVL